MGMSISQDHGSGSCRSETYDGWANGRLADIRDWLSPHHLTRLLRKPPSPHRIARVRHNNASLVIASRSPRSPPLTPLTAVHGLAHASVFLKPHHAAYRYNVMVDLPLLHVMSLLSPTDGDVFLPMTTSTLLTSCGWTSVPHW